MITPAISFVFGLFIPKCKTKSKCFHHKWYYHIRNDLARSSKGDICSQLQWKGITLRVESCTCSHVSEVVHIKVTSVGEGLVTTLHNMWTCVCIDCTVEPCLALTLNGRLLQVAHILEGSSIFLGTVDSSKIVEFPPLNQTNACEV